MNSFFKYLRAFLLVLLLLPVLWLAGSTARGIVAEFGLYYYDDDLVNQGLTRDSTKLHDAERRLRWVYGQTDNYFAGRWPFAYHDVDGAPLHGWMAQSLIYGRQGGVTQFIDFQKAWDDPTNKDAFSRRVQDYESPFRNLPRKNADGYALAHIAGNKHVFGPGGVRSDQDLKIGKSQTILAGDAAGNYQPWGKPGVDRDPALGINQSPNGFGGPWSKGGAMMVYADGSVRMMSKETSPEVLRSLAQPLGREEAPGGD